VPGVEYAGKVDRARQVDMDGDEIIVSGLACWDDRRKLRGTALHAFDSVDID